MPTQTRQTDLTKPTSEQTPLTSSSSADPTDPTDPTDPISSRSDSTSSTSSASTEEEAHGPEHPSKVTGQYHSLKGTLVEAIGTTTGSEAWRESGRREHEAGQRELEDAEQLFPIE